MNEKYPLALPKGTVLAGQYIIERVLGQGGFGITYEATDHKTGARVAVKEFFPDAMATRTGQTTVMPFAGEKGEHYAYGKTCFLQEAETLAKFIGNENIVRIHSYFEENETAYFVMDFIEGTSFDEYLKERGGKIPYEEAAGILIPVMDALNVVHSKGIVHRDVTPDNIYITKDGVVKLLDFGAARYSLGDQSRSLDVILKHGFAPKEQYTRRGKQGPYTDIYALGATFYFALTGKRPPDSVERLDEDDLVPPSSLGVQLSGAAEDAILKALSVQPGDRFQSMAAFKNALLGERAVAQPTPAAVGSPVVQTYFNAPAQGTAPAPAPVTPPAPTPPPFTAAERPAPTAAGGALAKRAPSKKLLMIGGGVAAAVLVLLIGVFAFLAGGKKNPATADDPTQAPTQQTTATPAPSFSFEPTPAPTPTPTPTQEPTDTLSGDWTVIGNSAGNIANYGLFVTLDGVAYSVEDGYHFLRRWDTDTYIVQNEEGSITNLIPVDGKLLFLYDSTPWSYDAKTGEFNQVPELEPFEDCVLQLLVTKDFYVICCSNDEGTCTVYRVLRSTGEAEVCCTIANPNRFTISDDGWIYYVSHDGEGLSYIYRMRLDTLKGNEILVMTKSSDWVYSNPIVAGDYLYWTINDGKDFAICRTDREIGFQDTDGADIGWYISSKLPLNLWYAVTLNVHPTNHMIYFSACPSGSSTPNLYSIKGNNDGSFDVKVLSEDSDFPNLIFFDNGNYEVNYWHADKESGVRTLYFQTFDAEGNPIKNN